MKDELPCYRATRDLRRPAFARVFFETPWTSSDSPDVYQYCGDRDSIRSGEVITTDAWPHESWVGLNEPAKQVLQFYRTATRSRLSIKPYRDGRLHLEDGLTGIGVTKLPGPALPPAFNTKPAA